jgi:BRO family, N-terminal domain/P63C domain
VKGELVPFVFDGRQVRTVMLDGAPWFVVSDLCAILGIQNAPDVAAKNLDTRDRVKIYISSSGQGRRVWVTNEPGMYRLILRSNKPDAEKFQDWICREVLPSIRKTGRYQVDLRGWLSTGPKPWTEMFPDRFFDEVFRLHGKDPSRDRDQEPWLAQVIIGTIYRRLTQGIVETFHTLNPVRYGKRGRRHRHHQYLSDGRADLQVRQLVSECIGTMSAAQNWEQFLSVWNAHHPIIDALPPGISATLEDGGQLWLFRPSQEGGPS